MPIALTIAGSDPSGGAGIQADLRVFHSFGVYGLSVITALTAQNSLGVQATVPVNPDIAAAQLQSLASDYHPLHVKIGMVGQAANAEAVARFLEREAPEFVLLDPVLASSGHVPLLDNRGISILIERVMPLCNLITPNLAEAEQLTGIKVNSLEQMERAGSILLKKGARAVLIKGGHLTGEPIDLLLAPSLSASPITLLGERISTSHTHGTGCYLSSAITALISQGFPLLRAVQVAKRELARGLSCPLAFGQGRGSPGFCGQAAAIESRSHAERLEAIQGVYVITDTRLQAPRTSEEIATAAVAGGSTVVQMRRKDESFATLFQEASAMRNVVQSVGGVLMINDRVDIALATDADGVHVGPEDATPQTARSMLGWGKLVGVSVGNLEEARKAAPYASYFGVGALFGTSTKLDAGAPIGLDLLGKLKAEFSDIPLVGIGGITLSNIASVAEAGADAAAVVSAAVAQLNVADAVNNLSIAFQRGLASR